MLSFEINKSGKVIQIYYDVEGLTVLKEAINNLEKYGHIHLRSPGCGGNELSEVTPFGHPAIEEVIITGDVCDSTGDSESKGSGVGCKE